MLIGVLLAVSVTMTACAKDSMVKDPDLTKQAALAQTLKYLERTEAALPESKALSVKSDAPGAIDPSVPSGSISCKGLGTADVDNESQLVYMSYFVTGVPQDQNTKYLRQISRLWESWGWTPTREEDKEWAAYVNEDGYTLSVRHHNEPGSLYLTAETPCIAPEKFTGGHEVPRHIGNG